MGRWAALAELLLRRLQRHELFVLAAAVSYAAVLSLFPLALTVIAVLGRFVEQDVARQAVVEALGPYLPPQALRSVGETLEVVAATRSAAGLIGTLGLLWGATALAGSLRHALNRVLEVRQPRGYLSRKLTELGLVLVGGLFLGLSVVASVALTLVERWAPAARLTAVLQASPLAGLFSTLGPWLFSAAAFFVTYRFLPNVPMRLRSLAAGTALAVALFEAAKRLFVWYLGTLARYPLVYGPIAGVVVFMVWVYVVAVLVLLGAELIGWLERPAEASSGD